MACFLNLFSNVEADNEIEDKTLKIPAIVEELFQEYANGEILDNLQLADFMKDHVHNGFQDTQADEIIGMVKEKQNLTTNQNSKLLPMKSIQRFQQYFRPHTSHTYGITLTEFLHVLLNPEITPALEKTVIQDMNEPLSHYFIYTGHNSYLQGNQITSTSSVRPIRAALERGVRVIELDLWPNDKKDAILVTHGGTLTKPVGFEECIAAIKEKAFVASDYPVIITLEDHLPPNLQADAATVLFRVLGALLWIPPPDTPMEEFPSPESLRGHIIISTQPPKPTKEEKSKKKKSDASSDPDRLNRVSLSESESGKSSSEVPVPSDSFEKDWGLEGDWGSSRIFQNYASFGTEENSEDEKTCSPGVSRNTQSESPAMTLRKNASDNTIIGTVLSGEGPQYGTMITIAGGRMPGEQVKVSLMDGDSVKRVSLSEGKLAAAAKGHPDDLIRFTQRNILRIYPKGMRVDSSNYNPLLAWTHGAQMVAINMQGYGKPLWLVHGFFMGNGGCGYVKKPSFFFGKKERRREIQNGEEGALEYWNPRYPGPVRIVLQVTILLGVGWLECFGKTHFDRFSPPDFYVQVGIGGVPADASLKKLETRTDQWHPSWEEHVLEFPLHAPELALLTIEVSEYDVAGSHAFAGQAVLPVRFLQQGIRCVPLYDRKGKILNSFKSEDAEFEEPSRLHVEGPRLLCLFKMQGQI